MKRVREMFALPDADGLMRAYRAGDLVEDNDPIVATHGALLEDVTPTARGVVPQELLDAVTVQPGETIERATAAPGETRKVK